MDLDREGLYRCFTHAVNDVIGTMAGFGVEGEDVDLENKHGSNNQVSGAMLLLGDRNAMFSLSMTYKTASVLVAYMTGIVPFDLQKEDIYDGVGELVNLIAGRAKAQLAGTEYYFQITPPFTIVGENHGIIPKAKVAKLGRKYTAGDINLLLELFYI